MSRRNLLLCAGALLAGALLAGCSDTRDPVAPAVRADVSQPAAPADLVTIPFGEGSLTLWNYTGDNFSGTPVDPINLLFPNRTPREVRAALLSLDGDRSGVGIPHVFPFDCVWQDAAGGTNQTAYTGSWVGSAIQLTCGAYGPVRFHIRLFPAGSGSVGGVHFEMQIPGTIDHAVLSWLLARNLVYADMVRSGLLAAMPTPVPMSTPTPSYRNVEPALLYWALETNPETKPLADQLGVIVMGENDVRLGNDGAAISFTLASTPEGERLVSHQAFTLDFDQIIPRPICATSEFDYVRVVGPIDNRLQVVATPSGNYLAQFFSQGKLQITPVNPSNGEPIGETFQAVLRLTDKNVVTDQTTLVSYVDVRMGMPASIFKGSAHIRMTVGPGGVSSYDLRLVCD